MNNQTTLSFTLVHGFLVNCLNIHSVGVVFHVTVNKNNKKHIYIIDESPWQFELAQCCGTDY